MRAPLFERLAEPPASRRVQSELYRIQDYQELKASVRREVACLLNTRSPMSIKLPEAAEGTVLDYGIPDFSALSPASEPDRLWLAQLIASKIKIYEPRLENVRVAFEPDKKNPRMLLGVIRAHLKVGTVMEPVMFPLVLTGPNSEVEVRDLVETRSARV